MMTSEMFDALQHNCKVYIKTGSEEFQELGSIHNVEISCEPCAFPTIKNEIFMHPSPDNPVSIKSSPKIEMNDNGITIYGETHYEPYTPCDLDMTPKPFEVDLWNKKHESCDFICEAVDAMRYCMEDIKDTKTLEEFLNKKEGINMELLNIYREKSLNNINKYYDELRDKEYNKNEAVKAVNELTEKFRENVNKLIEKYGEDVIVYDECYFEDSIMVDIDDTEEILKLHELEKECIDELDEKIKEINAHLQLLPPVEESTYDAVMPILEAYGVVDEHGKITPYTPTSSK